MTNDKGRPASGFTGWGRFPARRQVNVSIAMRPTPLGSHQSVVWPPTSGPIGDEGDDDEDVLRARLRRQPHNSSESLTGAVGIQFARGPAKETLFACHESLHSHRRPAGRHVGRSTCVGFVGRPRSEPNRNQ